METDVTFDEWYKDTYPGDWNLAIRAKSPPAIDKYEQAKAAWEAGYDDGYDDGYYDSYELHHS
jgi:hypothetical protein